MASTKKPKKQLKRFVRFRNLSKRAVDGRGGRRIHCHGRRRAPHPANTVTANGAASETETEAVNDAVRCHSMRIVSSPLLVATADDAGGKVANEAKSPLR